jgi:FkbM family methyltransferase
MRDLKRRRIRLISIFTVILAPFLIVMLEPNLRSTATSTIFEFGRMYFDGTKGSGIGDRVGISPLLYTNLKLGLHKAAARYSSGNDIKEVSILNYRLRAYDLWSVEFSFREIFLERPYMFHTARKSPVIFDCGSNIGISILFFKTLYPEAKIVAFEPSQTAYKLLSENVSRNKLQKVTLHKVALADKEGQLKFFSDSPGSLWASLSNDRGGKTEEIVNTARLSTYVSDVVDFLKIDIEGAERLVLEDLRNSDKLSFIKEMVIEYHHHIRPERDNLAYFLSILEENKFGYQIHSRFPPPFEKNICQDILIYAYNKRKVRRKRVRDVSVARVSD